MSQFSSHSLEWMQLPKRSDAMATSMMSKTLDKLDIPPIPEFIEMIHDAGGKLKCLAGLRSFSGNTTRDLLRACIRGYCYLLSE